MQKHIFLDVYGSGIKLRSRDDHGFTTFNKDTLVETSCRVSLIKTYNSAG